MTNTATCPKCHGERREPPRGGGEWCPETDGYQCLQAQLKRLKEHLGVLLDILEGDECQCVDPPSGRDPSDIDADDPAAHQQYCPQYLVGYVRNLIDGKLGPDPHRPEFGPSEGG